jgi:hypothetical protein
MRKSHDQACAIPQFDILAANKLPRCLDGFFIMGAFDDFWWSRNLVGLVDKIDAIFGRGGLIQVRPRSSRRPSLARCGSRIVAVIASCLPYRRGARMTLRRGTQKFGVRIPRRFRGAASVSPRTSVCRSAGSADDHPSPRVGAMMFAACVGPWSPDSHVSDIEHFWSKVH